MPLRARRPLSSPSRCRHRLRVTPKATADTAATVTGEPVTINVLGNDHASHGTLKSVQQPPAGEGTTTIVDGKIVFTPANGFVGTATFSYTAVDSLGQTATSTVTVTVPAPAAATNDSQTGTIGQPATVDPLNNDTATAGSSLVPTTLQLVDPKTGAHVLSLVLKGQGTYTVDPKTGTVTFTPEPGFSGSPTPVKYVVKDGTGKVRTATITISYPTVEPGLPFTGGDWSSLVGIAASTLLVGLFLVVLARRRSRTE